MSIYKPMKILISGTQCSGKTTLLRALQEQPKFKDFDFVIEMVRNLTKEGVKVNEKSDDESQLRILDATIKQLQITKPTIYDRSILDVFCYSRYFRELGQMTNKTLEIVKEQFNKHIDEFDYIFITRPEFDVVPDGFRSIDIKYRNRINEIFDEIIREYGLITYDLTGSVEKRLNKFLSIVEL